MIRKRPQPRNVFEAIIVDGDESQFVVRPASRPTSARPGSEEKVEVLRQRVEAGEALWHPDDERVLTDRPSSYTDNCIMRRIYATMQVRVRSAI